MKTINQLRTNKTMFFLAILLCSGQIKASVPRAPLAELSDSGNKRSAEPTDAENPPKRLKLSPTEAAGILASLNAAANSSSSSSSSSSSKEKCPVENCKVTFKTHLGLKNHTLLHTDNGLSFKCTSCSLYFTRHCSLTKHANTYGCPVAIEEQEENSSSSSTKEKTSRETFHCSVTGCNKSYYTSSALRNHTQSNHTATPTRFSCEKCPETYKDRKALLNHLKAHLPSNGTFACQQCKTFYQKSAILMRHINKHHKESGHTNNTAASESSSSASAASAQGNNS